MTTLTVSVPDGPFTAYVAQARTGAPAPANVVIQ